MQLSNYILDLGRAVAYYPGLKLITGSTTATIMLCQFLYWTDKSKYNGWVWKTSGEIEEETGLTYNEQRTARRILVEKSLLEEEFKRLDHTTRFRINVAELNSQWEKATGKKAKAAEAKKRKEDKNKNDIAKEQPNLFTGKAKSKTLTKSQIKAINTKKARDNIEKTNEEREITRR